MTNAGVLSNYKSFVISLMRCRACEATFELKENAHRPREQERDGGGAPRPAKARPSRSLPPLPEPRYSHTAEPTPAPKRRKPAKKLERPFNIRVTRRTNS